MPRVLSVIAGAVIFALACPIGCSNGQHESFKGCRSPSESGCATCCVDGPSGCREQSWAPAGATTEVEPWYNAASTIDGPCPATCAPCASCLLRAEQELRALGCRSDCNCALIDPGIVPCFGPESCECYCFRLTGLKASCPAVPACLY
jgi:hypothetical protein